MNRPIDVRCTDTGTWTVQSADDDAISSHGSETGAEQAAHRHAAEHGERVVIHDRYQRVHESPASPRKPGARRSSPRRQRAADVTRNRVTIVHPPGQTVRPEQPQEAITMTSQNPTHDAHLNDWIEARGLPGQPSRRGQIVGLLGRAGHEHYRVRWDEQHESIVYPADGVIVTHTERAHSVPRVGV